jgi:Mg-chelatase subunit ChlD
VLDEPWHEVLSAARALLTCSNWVGTSVELDWHEDSSEGRAAETLSHLADVSASMAMAQRRLVAKRATRAKRVENVV